MRIEVLGTGCAKCNKLSALAKKAADELNVPCEITHVRDIDTIIQRGVMVTPALAINGHVVVSGRLPTEAELTAWLTTGQG